MKSSNSKITPIHAQDWALPSHHRTTPSCRPHSEIRKRFTGGWHHHREVSEGNPFYLTTSLSSICPQHPQILMPPKVITIFVWNILIEVLLTQSIRSHYSQLCRGRRPIQQHYLMAFWKCDWLDTMMNARTEQ